MTRACGLCLFALGGRWVGLHFLYLTVNGWPGPPMFFPSSLCCPLVSTSGMTPFFFFLLPKVCKQESRGLQAARQLCLLFQSVEERRPVSASALGGWEGRPPKGHPHFGGGARALASIVPPLGSFQAKLLIPGRYLLSGWHRPWASGLGSAAALFVSSTWSGISV